MKSQPLVDPRAYGRLVRAARILAGFDRVEDASRAIEERTGVTVSTRTLYAIERGEQTTTMEQFAAIAITFDPPSGEVYWTRCFSPRYLEWVVERRQIGGA